MSDTRRKDLKALEKLFTTPEGDQLQLGGKDQLEAYELDGVVSLVHAETGHTVMAMPLEDYEAIVEEETP